ncbi:hypothetical protein JKP88DRAFT_155673, partial [Tribonema minus]
HRRTHAPQRPPSASARSAAAEQVAARQHSAERNQQRMTHLTSRWQSNQDRAHRRKILSRVVLYLQQRKPNARPEWIREVPRTAQRLENSLYRKAATFAEYNDMKTLHARLQQLALRLGHNARQAKLQA